ncbi:tetraspanin-17 isoform X4 [Drosophila miranda]|uniref:Tetraspanin n=1 Tax=Drosophila pseudoobscura pseudoobscura TaxID=46245 RepID=A0A0R3NWZ5_DROPS|nr:tetraspanin-17 isoform X2 [Drosophila pseudoobscura]XP_017154344.1 tetraspanin-17 isoform X4 [Drosophila miranda]XP_026845015.1 tetraspanin-17 isoform X1 [Drosophila persimilis]
MPAVRKYRRETSEISCCLKYLLFTSNVFIWMAALMVLAVGIWAWSEKDMFRNIAKLSFIALDPAFVLIILGGITFLLGFMGSVGALRENTCLLAAYAIFLSILLIAEIGFCALAFVLKDKGWIKDQATEGLKAFIRHYREDADQQNLIDWIQEDWLQCCGIDGPKDWDSNNYFNCSSIAIGSREACGVPFSCCRRRPQELIKNKQCGYDVRKEGYPVDRNIHERGCLRAGEDWLEAHLISVAAACVGLLMLQILGICFAQNLRADIYTQKSKWH